MSSERKYYQLPLDPNEDKDIAQHLDRLNRNTRPEFVKAAIREKMGEKREKELSEVIEKVLSEKLPSLLEETLKSFLEQSKQPTKEKPVVEKKKPKKPTI